MEYRSDKSVSKDALPQWSETQQLFQAWLALPEDEREPKTQAELAERLGVHAITLTRWKGIPGFYKAAHDAAYNRLKDALPAVFRNIARRASDGDRREWVDLYLSMMGGAAAVAGANSTMQINQMSEDEATTLLENAIGLRLTARVTQDTESQETEHSTQSTAHTQP